MKTYTTRTGQNIFDVCMVLYGSIEGVLDLLVCNPSLSIEDYGPSELKGKPLTMGTTLSRGVILNYHESLSINDNALEFFEDNKTIIANGEHDIDIPDINHSQVLFIIAQSGLMSTIKMASNYGTIYIDWGDFSSPDKIEPSETYTFEHVYNSVGNHQIKIYCDTVPTFKLIDFSSVNGIPYPTDEIYTEAFKTNNNDDTLSELINIGDREGAYHIIDVSQLDTKSIQ